MKFSDIIEKVLTTELSEKIKPGILKKMITKSVLTKIEDKLTKEIFFELLKTKKIKFMPGFGSLEVRDLETKRKLVFDKKEKIMVPKICKKSRIVFNPGTVLNEFL